MKLSYKIIGTPKPQARPRFFRSKVGYMGTYSPKTDWFNLVYSETLKQKEEMLKGEKLSGILSVKIVFAMPIPKSISKKKRATLHYVDKKPDIDNLIKAVLDAINYTNLWEDDSHIAKLESEKIYSVEPSCNIEIEQIGN